MATEVFANFVNTTLAGSIGPTATSFTVASGTGSTFPQPAAGQFGRLTFTDQTTGNLHEIMTYTGISGDTVTGVTRGPSPLSWSAGDIIESGPTAETMAEFQQSGQAQSNSATYAPDTGSANAYAIAPSPAIAGTPAAGTRLFFKAVAANTGASTLSVNGTSYPLTGSNGPLAANEIVANGNVAVVWNSTYSGFELVSCTRAEVAVPAATVSGHAVNLGQLTRTPTNVAGSRASGTNYTNSTLKERWVSVWTGNALLTSLTATVSGLVVAQNIIQPSGGNGTSHVGFPVPPGAIYSVAVVGGIGGWVEWQ